MKHKDFPLVYGFVIAAYVIQWIAFIPAYCLTTEKFYDLTGSFTYLSITITAIILSGHTDTRSILIAVFICTWAGRLGSFLAIRVHKAGEDSRFAEIKRKFWKFFMTWTLQGLWVTCTIGAGLTAILSDPVEMDGFAYAGAIIWFLGFDIEVVADAQKSAFRRDPENKDKFITSGLWSWSRHPNYFGEIVLWFGIAIMAIPTLKGAQYVTLISPFFVTLLLTMISGIPLLEESADKKWGGQPEYGSYKQRTSALIPFPPREAAPPSLLTRGSEGSNR